MSAKPYRKELSPAFLAASQKKGPAKDILTTLLRITEEIRSDILLPSSRILDQLDISYKENDNLRIADAKNVTIKTDLECEALAEKRLRDAFPDAHFIGEEMFGKATRTEKIAFLQEALATDKRVILVDALDGTRDFRQGGDGYGVMIAVLEKGEIVAAVVHRATDHARPDGLGRTLTYGKGAGEGVRINGELIKPLSDRVFDNATEKLRGYATYEFIDTAKGKNVPGYPDLNGVFDSLSDLWTCGKMYEDILTGRHHFMLVAPPVDLFDYPAGIALIAAAGGTARFLDGTPATFSEIVKRQDNLSDIAVEKSIDNSLVLCVNDATFMKIKEKIPTALRKTPKAPPPSMS